MSIFDRMISCRDCGQTVSRTAKLCPKCGARYPAVPQWACFVIVCVILLPIFAPQFFILLRGCR